MDSVQARAEAESKPQGIAVCYFKQVLTTTRPATSNNKDGKYSQTQIFFELCLQKKFQTTQKKLLAGVAERHNHHHHAFRGRALPECQ